jgi:6-phosphogluconolactonase
MTPDAMTPGAEQPAVRRLLVGGYSAPQGGADGISLIEHNVLSHSLEMVGLACRTASPSYLAHSADGRIVFAVQEGNPGYVHSFRWTGPARERLEPVSTQPSGGVDPCHILLHHSGRYLLTANYTAGGVVAHPIATDGSLGPITGQLEFTGSGPISDRQAGSHPHMIADGHGTLVVVDLGADAVWPVHLDLATGALSRAGSPMPMPPGSGPRQIGFSPEGGVAYVLGELDGTVTVTSWPPARTPRTPRTGSAAFGPLPTGNLAAALLVSNDGELLYASHRGADVITVLHADDSTATPSADLPSGGREPRDIALIGSWLYAANQGSGTVTAVPADPSAAKSQRILEVGAPQASCVLPVPSPRTITAANLRYSS